MNNDGAYSYWSIISSFTKTSIRFDLIISDLSDVNSTARIEKHVSIHMVVSIIKIDFVDVLKCILGYIDDKIIRFLSVVRKSDGVTKFKFYIVTLGI